MEKTWTMNCILFGAKAFWRLMEGKREQVIEEIKNLSDFSQKDAEYLVKRLENLR